MDVHRFYRVWFVLLTCGLWMGCVSVAAQSPVDAPVGNADDDAEIATDLVETSELSPEMIDAELATIAANGELQDTEKQTLTEGLQRAKQMIQNATTESEQAKRYSEQINTVVDQSQRVQALLDERDAAEVTVPPDASLEVLSQRLGTATAELQSANKKVTDLAAEPAKRRNRTAEIPGLISEAEQELTETVDQLTAVQADDATTPQSTARELALLARRDELRAVIDRLTSEQAAYLATTELLPLQQKLASQSVERLNREIVLLQDAIAAKQKQKAIENEAALKDTVASVPKPLQPLARRNLELGNKQSELINELAAAQQTLRRVQAAVETVSNELQTSEDRVEAVGLTDALGLMFREKRKKFEITGFEFRPKNNLRKAIQQSQIDSFQLEDELEDVQRQLAASDPPSLDWESENVPWSDLTIADAQWMLLRKRQKQLEDTLQSQNEVLQIMLASDFSRRQLEIEIDRFTDFVDRHLFWTRSAPALSIQEFRTFPVAMRWIGDASNWSDAGNQMLATTATQPVLSLALLGLIVGLIYARPRFRRTISAESKQAHRFNATYVSTIRCLMATVGGSVTWPVIFALIAFLLLSSSNSNTFVRGLGIAFAATSIFIASRKFLKEVCRNNGLAESHFGWSDDLRGYLKRHLRWYTLFGGVALFISILFNEHPDPVVRAFVTRFSSAALFIVTALFHHVMLRKQSPLYIDVVRLNPDSILYRWQRLAWIVAVGAPFAFGLMSIAGYLETTIRLGRSLQSSFLLLVVYIVLLGLLARWLTLHRRDTARRTAMEARERRLAAQQSETGDAAAVALEAGIVLDDETKMDLPRLDHQTRQTALVLVTTITLFILAFLWSDTLPALDYLSDKEAWTVGSGTEIDIVTWKDVLYVLIGSFIAFLATRNLPSLLELLVLSRTDLDSGARYAITTLLRYALIVVSALVLLNLLSVPYNQLGWLVAAASVGLGFGLQEIVANFVSGIILLLERPVRVGDVVTIDNTTGIVSRIQMRSTTVTNWDRKELVIPNKDLITEKLLNWSLTNVVNRLTINVGVAYGTDPDRVREILKRIVADHPDVLDDPPPLINFETFGDSSLNFVVRFFLPKLDNRIEVTHQINCKIAKAFAEADIEIPFPQRDLHIMTASEHSTAGGNGTQAGNRIL